MGNGRESKMLMRDTSGELHGFDRGIGAIFEMGCGDCEFLSGRGDRGTGSLSRLLINRNKSE